MDKSFPVPVSSTLPSLNWQHKSIRQYSYLSFTLKTMCPERNITERKVSQKKNPNFTRKTWKKYQAFPVDLNLVWAHAHQKLQDGDHGIRGSYPSHTKISCSGSKASKFKSFGGYKYLFVFSLSTFWFVLLIWEYFHDREWLSRRACQGDLHVFAGDLSLFLQLIAMVVQVNTNCNKALKFL